MVLISKDNVSIIRTKLYSYFVTLRSLVTFLESADRSYGIRKSWSNWFSLFYL